MLLVAKRKPQPEKVTKQNGVLESNLSQIILKCFV